MSYFPNIPQPNDDPSDSQSELLANFGKMNSDFSINHTALTSATNQGMHTLLNFSNVQGADPDLASPKSSVYTKTVSGSPELFFQNGNTSADVVQLTNLPDNLSGTNRTFETPWGFRLHVGSAAASPVSYADPFTSAGFTLFAILVTPTAGTNLIVTSNDKDGFTYTVTGGTGINYLVLGKD